MSTTDDTSAADCGSELSDQLGLVERLRQRRMLATDGSIGYGRANAKATWITDEADPDCDAAAVEILRLRAELAEAQTALPQAVRNERERCAAICDRLGHSVLAHVAASEIRRPNV